MSSQPCVLIIDDAPESIDVLRGLLGNEFRIRASIHGKAAVSLATEYAPDLILLDVMMPEIDGYEVCRALKSNPCTRDIPIIFCTTRSGAEDEAKGLSLGAADYIAKPYVAELVCARVRTHVALHHKKVVLEQLVQERTKDLLDSRLELIHRLGLAAEYRDNETGLHVVRMSRYSHLVARAYGLSETESEIVLHAAPMHDIGKIGTPDSILLKPGKLSPGEWTIMKQHSAHGAKIIGDQTQELLRAAHDVALNHHEKWDGSGYPGQLSGNDIPLIGRIVAVADVMDALLSDRPYKKAWSIDKTLNLIDEQRGKHFDPGAVDALFKVIPEVQEIRSTYAEKPGICETRASA